MAHDASEAEVELKLLCSASGAKRVWSHPAVKALLKDAPRARRVRTVYHDTPAADLMRSGCALRVREIDGVFEQHLKTAGSVAGGLFQRQEWHAPLASAQPDPDAWDGAANDLVAPHAHALRPLFETDMLRTDALLSNGLFAVEIAVDVGTIRAFDPAGEVMRETALAEIELEWKSGPAEHVFDLARDLAAQIPLRLGWQSKAERGYASALALAPEVRRAAQPEIPRDATVGIAAAAILGEGMAHFLANQEYLETAAAAEAVHQMRVACRRLRAALSLFRAHLPPDETESCRDGLRRVALALGAVRDIDVLGAEILDPIAADAATPDEVREGIESLRPALAHRRSENLRQAIATLHAAETTRALLSLGRRISMLGGSDSSVDAGDFADTLLAKRRRKLVRLGRKLGKQPPAARHQVRIAAKKVRYAAEFFRSRYPDKPMRRFLGALGDLQDALGALNDVAAVPAVLHPVADTPTAHLVAGYAMGWHTHRLRSCLDDAEELMRVVRKGKPFTRKDDR